jgi:hypothetical protein
MKPEAARLPKLFGSTQAGIRQAEIRAATHMARLRPTHCERYPIIVPPTQAPVFIKILAVEATVLFMPFWVLRNVV